MQMEAGNRDRITYMDTVAAPRRIPVGISCCLPGEAVRYNGGNTLSRLCRDQLSEYFEFQDVCPEVVAGLGVPREPMRLVEMGDGSPEVRVVQIADTSRDCAWLMSRQVDQQISGLKNLCGFIFMHNSPSCGAFRVKVYHPNGTVLHTRGEVHLRAG